MVTRGYMGLPEVKGVKRGYRGLQEITEDNKGLQGDTRGYKGLQRVTRGLKPPVTPGNPMYSHVIDRENKS